MSESISRHELKFLVDPDTAERVREDVTRICALDRHANGGRYLVNTLYLDTPEMRFYGDVRFGRARRVKPRVRWYGVSPGPRIWLEVKAREASVNMKRRNPVPTSMWPGILSPALHAAPTGMMTPFEALVAKSAARPVLHVRYEREPWISGLDDYARVTFDRALRVRSALSSPELPRDDFGFTYVAWETQVGEPEAGVLIEMKSALQIPRWMGALIRRHGLEQRGFSKYGNGIDALTAAGAWSPLLPGVGAAER